MNNLTFLKRKSVTNTNLPDPVLAPEPGQSPRAVRLAEANLYRWLFLTLLALYLFTLGGHLYSGDGFSSYATAWSLVEGRGGALENYFVDPRFGIYGRDEHFFSKYGAGQVAVEIPVVLLVKGLALISPAMNADQIGRLLVSLLNGLIVAYSAVLLCRITRGFGYGVRAGLGVALLYGVGTMAWAYAHLDFSEPLIALLYLLMARSLFDWPNNPEDSRKLLKVGGWLFLAVTVKVAAGIAALPILLYIIYYSFQENSAFAKRKFDFGKIFARLFWFGLPLAGALLFTLGYNYYRFGSISETGYSAIKDQFALGSIYGGIYGFLFSPGKSVFLYSPGLLFALFGLPQFREKVAFPAFFGIALALTYLLFYSLFWNWEGDWTWGPRYLLPIFPFVAMWAAPLLQNFGKFARHGFFLGLSLAALINLLGMLIQFDQYFLANYNAGVNQDWRFVPELSPIRGQFYLVTSAVSRLFGGPSLTMDYLAWDSVRVQAIRAIIPLQNYDDFDLWWLRPANTGNWLTALIAGGFFVALIFFAARRLLRFYSVLKEFENY